MVQSYSDISQEENVLKFYLCKSMIKEEEFATKPNKKNPSAEEQRML